MTSYLETNNLLPCIQSGFRKGHSTETLLLRLLSDVYAAIDSSQLTLLVLFDVSAAFNTVDHEILLKRLKCIIWFIWHPAPLAEIISHRALLMYGSWVL